jgi:membrane peptidoglycan carboxypeptidase
VSRRQTVFNAALARGGLRVQPRFVRTTGDGAVETPQPRLVSARTAFWITDILSDDEAREFAFGRGGSLEFPFKVAAKTGTSQGYHDNWALGYTRAVTVGVWVGNFDQKPLIGSSGVSGAGPIFHAVMLAAEQRVTGRWPRDEETATLAAADNTMRRRICALSGMAANPWCGAGRRVDGSGGAAARMQLASSDAPRDCGGMAAGVSSVGSRRATRRSSDASSRDDAAGRSGRDSAGSRRDARASENRQSARRCRLPDRPNAPAELSDVTAASDDARSRSARVAGGRPGGRTRRGDSSD